MHVVQVLASFGSEYRKHMWPRSTSDKETCLKEKKTWVGIIRWLKKGNHSFFGIRGWQKNVHDEEAKLLLVDYQKARTKAGFTRAAAVANQQELRRVALIWAGCVKELALSPVWSQRQMPINHFLFRVVLLFFCSVTLVKVIYPPLTRT